MITSKFIYAGAELDSASSNLLKPFHKEGWQFYGHHMTIHFGLRTLPSYIKEWLKDNVGKQYPLTVIAIGQSDKAIAVQVEMDDIPCSNNLRHITVSVAPGCKPVDSNSILNWHYIEPFKVNTTIKIYTK